MVNVMVSKYAIYNIIRIETQNAYRPPQSTKYLQISFTTFT